MCDNVNLNSGTCFNWYAEPGEVIANSTIFNLICGFILFATFFHTLRRFYVMNMEALGGVSSGFCLPIHVFFLQASTVWAVCWAMYKVFSTDRRSSNWQYYHYFADSVVLAGTVCLETMVCLYMVYNNIGKKAVFVSKALGLSLGAVCGGLNFYFGVKNTPSDVVSNLVPCGEALGLRLTGNVVSLVFYGGLSAYVYNTFQNHSLLPYSIFLMGSNLFAGLVNSLMIGGEPAGYCLLMLSSLYYYSLYAPILYETIIRDSNYWTGAHLWSPQYQRLVVPSNQLVHVRDLAKGASGVAALYKWQGKEVVVKKLRDSEIVSIDRAKLTQFFTEADILRSMRHDHIVEFHGVYFEPPQMGIMMEHCKHGSLFHFLHEARDAPDLDVFSPIKVARDIARAMVYLQNRAKPVLYRDLKSKNVLIDEQLQVKLADFGDSNIVRENFSAHMSIKGTPCYMAPEVLRRQAITLKSDVFSFGILLWELVTWLPPTFDQRLVRLDIENKTSDAPGSGGSHSGPAGASKLTPQPRRSSASAAAAGAVWNGDAGTNATNLRTPFLLAAGTTPGSIDSDYKDGGLTQFHTPPTAVQAPLLTAGAVQFHSVPPPEYESNAADAAAAALSRRLMSQQEKEDRASRIHNWTYDQLCIPDSVQSAREMIADQGRRPPIPNSCPQPIRQLIAKCWLDSAEARPTFAQISIELEALEQSLDKIIRHKFPFR